jgi:adenine-specific DNA-methyltransferase
MASPFQQLRAKLSELFQLEAAAELDFGIYRILNSRRTEIVHFLDGLEAEVSRVLEANPDPKTAALRDELKKVEAGLRLGGFEEEMIQSAPKVKELRAQLASAAPTDPALLQYELFSHLTTFFSRYYKDGDFLSLRRYTPH